MRAVLLAMVPVDLALSMGHAFFDRWVARVVLLILSEAGVAAPCSIQAALYAENGDPVMDDADVQFFDVD